jgi:hypothetical protein
MRARFLLLIALICLPLASAGTALAQRPKPPKPPAPPESSRVIEVQIDDSGVQVKDGEGKPVTLRGDSAGLDIEGIRSQIEISDDGDTIVVHKRGPIRIESSTSDVVRMGSDITVGPEEVVQGDVVAIGGNVDVLGHVMGDCVAIGGILHLAPTARVNGDAVSIGGQVDKDPGAEVNGETVSVGIPLPPIGPFAHSPVAHTARRSAAVSKIIMLAITAFLVFLVLSFWREKVRAMALVIPERPWRLLFLGVAVWILFVPACILLVISIIGILFLPVFIVLVMVAFLLGLVTVYQFVGERFRGGAYAGRPFASAFVGMAIVHSFSFLGAILGALLPGLSPLAGALSVFGFMLWFFAATVGMGCVVHTRFGRRNMIVPPATDVGGGAAAPGWGYSPPPPPPAAPPGGAGYGGQGYGGPGYGGAGYGGESPPPVPPAPDAPRG